MPLAPPPLDVNGEVQPHDHQGILNEHGVLRRVSPHHLVDDEKAPAGRRLSSMAFQPSSGLNGGMSVDLENSIIDAGEDPRQHVVQPPFVGAVRFTAGLLRGLDFRVGFHPIQGNPHHGEVWGEFTNLKKKQLLTLAEPFVDPA
ncbi:hypothetical protein E0I74_26720 [Rhizobium laguerreae]|uniref:hypothetical protein n=1 Tax=Rhizobium laguerreae TaxID=1076926 RepID=UPI001038942C|nr:hypothetical protein [Rhizobium laguerreae]TBX74435.1 hypothetical protein E0I74_26720 [Rhizobium laguerreae]TBY13042.1 hypothetical protein E0I94_07930 [Rhizobium laguerreae]